MASSLKTAFLRVKPGIQNGIWTIFIERPHLRTKLVHFNELKSQGKTKLNLDCELNKLRRVFPFFCRAQVCPETLILEVQMQRQHFFTNDTSFSKVFIVDVHYKGMHHGFIITILLHKTLFR